MRDINFNLVTEEGKKAKDVTESKKILDIIAFYEKNAITQSQGNEQNKPAMINIIEEENEEDDRCSSYTPSPNLENPLKNTGEII